MNFRLDFVAGNGFFAGMIHAVHIPLYNNCEIIQYIGENYSHGIFVLTTIILYFKAKLGAGKL
jgi:hypothetical protein